MPMIFGRSFGFQNASGRIYLDFIRYDALLLCELGVVQLDRRWPVAAAEDGRSLSIPTNLTS